MPGFSLFRPDQMMDKTFEPAAVEARIAAAWNAADAFAAGRKSRAGAEPYCIVIPPPNVTGSLHMGHALNNTLQDILCRYERMRGKDVLWQPGTDHAGIATQMVVERKLASEQKPNRRDMGRVAFLEEVWAWKDESGGTIVNQLKRLGASCDWSRERFTMGNRADGENGQMQQAVIEFFLKLHEKGLVYKDKRLVNWDPKLLTAISDLEVEQIEIKGHMWYFNYPLEGVEYNREDDRTFITIATTRPETMLGDGAVAVHPENERLGWMIGKKVLLPLVNRIIPIIADEYADPEKGTGAVKITAAHDFNDYEVARCHGIPLINLFNPDASLNENTPEQYRGLDRFEARKRVVADLEALGLLNKIEPHLHAVPHGDRSGVVIEPYLTDQWYVNVKPLAEQAMASVRDGRTRIIPAKGEADFFRWMENIEPWCISRQLWWGHQIPAWYGPSIQLPLGHPHLHERKVFIAKSEGDARLAAEDHYGSQVQFIDNPNEFQTAVEQFVLANPGNGPVYIGKVPLCRETDVLDTWFSSALWPFSTLGWPDKTPELAKFYPGSALVTGADILFFWVARMMMAGLFTQGEVPFRDVYLHGLVRDAKGRKMSKSVGNVIDPLVVINEYGADALRFTLAALAAQGRDPKLDVKTAEGYRNFATKIWNAARFAEMNGCARAVGFDPAKVAEPLNRWVLSETAKAFAEVEGAVAAYRFNDAAMSAYRFVWGVFCDWYLELAKPVLQGADSASKDEARATVAHVIDLICQLLHPFMPFLTEELWAVKSGEGAPRAAQPDGDTLVCLSRWPDLAGLADEKAEAEIGFIVDLICDIRSVRSEANVPAGTQVPLVMVKASESTTQTLRSWAPMVQRLARLSAITFADVTPPQSAQIVVRGEIAAMPLAGIIDIDGEKQRLTKELAKLDQDILTVDRKLANADFMARAPEEIVEENHTRKVNALARKARIADALARLG
jgi:valyl-tRNA synthetase